MAKKASSKNPDHLFKLLLIGDSGVGKTCIIFRCFNWENEDVGVLYTSENSGFELFTFVRFCSL